LESEFWDKTDNNAPPESQNSASPYALTASMLRRLNVRLVSIGQRALMEREADLSRWAVMGIGKENGLLMEDWDQARRMGEE